MGIELEDVINHLTGPHRMSLKSIMEKLGLERGMFQSWRRSSDPLRRSKLGEAIMEKYPEIFPDGVIPGKETDQGKDSSSLQMKLFELLEKSMEELRKDRDRLRDENEKKINDIEKTLLEIKETLARN